VHVLDATGTQTASMARSRADGTWSTALPPASYQVRAVADDRAVGSPQTLPLPHEGIANLRLQLGGSSRLDVSVVDERGPIPAKIVAEPVAYGRATLPAALGEAWDFQPVVAFAPAGTASLPVFPGEWQVTSSRGFEYEVSIARVQAMAGVPTAVRAQIRRSVDTSGWISGDFHVHAQNSIDGTDLLSEKVRAFAAEGVEVPVSTEHEYIGDFGPTVSALGLGAFMHPLAGTELTTTFIGHFNLFPLQPDAAAVNRGALQWYGRNVPDVIAEARQRRTAAGLAPVAQLNHPRSLGMAYLDALQFDPFSFTVQANAPHFMTGWDAMEIWNGQPLERVEGCPLGGATCVPASHPTLGDWFAFLDRGLRVTATGNSDSHAASVQAVGYPRTFVQVGADDPATVQDAALLAGLRSQQAVISGGPFLRVSAPGASGQRVGPGGIASVDAAGMQPVVNLAIDVQAPLWMGPLSRVDIWRGDANALLGAVLAVSLDLTSGPYQDTGAKVQRVSTTVQVPTPVDTWLVVTVRGANADALWPVVQSRLPPFALSNPIWVDANGDGQITPLR
jgi:hypothetical protein